METTGYLATSNGPRKVIVMGATRTDSNGQTWTLIRFPERAWKYGIWERAEDVTTD